MFFNSARSHESQTICVVSSRFIPGCAFGCFTSFLIFCTSICLLLFVGSNSSTSGISRHVISGPDTIFPNKCDKVAVIKITETIQDTEGFIFKQIQDVLEDETVKAIVLRMETPGGTVSASDYFYHKLSKLRKERKIPIVVSMGGICASGGYYVSMACGTENTDVLFAEPTTWTGSIGVILSNYDLSELAQKVGVKDAAIKSHELKGMGNPINPMTEEERKILQELVDDASARFREVVYSGRKKFADDHEALTPLATGQVFTTSEALQCGLVDREGYLEDAIDRAIALAKLSKSDTQVYTYTKEIGVSDLLSATHDKMCETPIQSVQKVTSPKSYYLWQ